MTRHLWIAVLLLCCNGLGQQPKPAEPKPQDAVLATQRKFVEAMGNKNVAVLNRIIADDFVGVGAAGRLSIEAGALPVGVPRSMLRDPERNGYRRSRIQAYVAEPSCSINISKDVGHVKALAVIGFIILNTLSSQRRHTVSLREGNYLRLVIRSNQLARSL